MNVNGCLKMPLEVPCNDLNVKKKALENSETVCDSGIYTTEYCSPVAEETKQQDEYINQEIEMCYQKYECSDLIKFKVNKMFQNTSKLENDSKNESRECYVMMPMLPKERVEEKNLEKRKILQSDGDFGDRLDFKEKVEVEKKESDTNETPDEDYCTEDSVIIYMKTEEDGKYPERKPDVPNDGYPVQEAQTRNIIPFFQRPRRGNNGSQSLSTEADINVKQCYWMAPYLFSLLLSYIASMMGLIVWHYYEVSNEFPFHTAFITFISILFTMLGIIYYLKRYQAFNYRCTKSFLCVFLFLYPLYLLFYYFPLNLEEMKMNGVK